MLQNTQILERVTKTRMQIQHQAVFVKIGKASIGYIYIIKTSCA